jgi:hypothetical protein
MPRLRYPKRLDSGESSFLSIPTRMDAKLVRDFGGGAATWAKKLELGQKSSARVLGPLAKSGFIVI